MGRLRKIRITPDEFLTDTWGDEGTRPSSRADRAVISWHFAASP